MHPNCQKIFESRCIKYFREGIKVLEVGPPLESKWYRKTVRQKKACLWDTVDIRKDRSPSGKHHDVTFTGTPYSYPIKNNEYNIVFASMVLEHVPMPWRWMCELERICKPGGFVIIIAPFVGIQHGNVDCWRVLPQGLSALAEYAKLQVVESEVLDLVVDDYHIDSLLVGKK